MTSITRRFVKIPVLLLTAFIFVACGSGGGGGGSSSFVAPFGMDGLIITLSNSASFEFVSDAGQDADGTETGTIRYLKNVATTLSLINITGVTSQFEWPEQFSFSRYQYSRIGESTARITFYGTSSPTDPLPSVLGGLTEADPGAFTIVFEVNGGFIGALQMTLELELSGVIYTGDVAGQLRKTDLTPVEIGYDPDANNAGPQPSKKTDGEFNGDYLRLVDDLPLLDGVGDPILDAEGEEVHLTQSVICSARAITDTGEIGFPVTEMGVCSVTDEETADVAEANYKNSQLYGTDDVTMELTYTASTGVVPADVTYTLTFESDESGTYAGSDGSTGTFTLFATGS